MIDITILKVKIRSIYDDYCVFILSGVIKLFIKNYSSGNIVGNIFLFDFSSIPREIIKEWDVSLSEPALNPDNCGSQVLILEAMPLRIQII